MWFTPHVDLFATYLNLTIPLYVSPVPVQHAWDMDALNINWSGLTAYTYPPMALLHRVIHVGQYNCLIFVMIPGWPGMHWFWDLVHFSTEIPLQLPVSTTSQPPRLVSRSGWLEGRSFSVEVAWALFEIWCRENSVDFSTPSVNKSQIFSCTCTKF